MEQIMRNDATLSGNINTLIIESDKIINKIVNKKFAKNNNESYTVATATGRKGRSIYFESKKLPSRTVVTGNVMSYGDASAEGAFDYTYTRSAHTPGFFATLSNKVRGLVFGKN